MKKILLHSCCAPCSSAILEWLVQNDYDTTVYFFDPNIFPRSEYIKRRDENIRYCEQLGVEFVDGEYDYKKWRDGVWEFRDEPERGKRCQKCFDIRMIESARYASEHGFELFTTTLATSRWKDLKQVSAAGHAAEAMYPSVKFWDRNWRKGGLFERRNVLARQFYNQKYCGCEFSLQNRIEFEARKAAEAKEATKDAGSSSILP
ncbi:MAG: epoxyqueuosine reductase QueH [Bacteroidales bacterium]